MCLCLGKFLLFCDLRSEKENGNTMTRIVNCWMINCSQQTWITFMNFSLSLSLSLSLSRFVAVFTGEIISHIEMPEMSLVWGSGRARALNVLIIEKPQRKLLGVIQFVCCRWGLELLNITNILFRFFLSLFLSLSLTLFSSRKENKGREMEASVF